jgi:filamentous hemagglutinin family protein
MGSGFAAALQPASAYRTGGFGRHPARKGRGVFLLATSALVGAGLTAGGAYANPTGGQVVGGAATISEPNASTVNVNQTTDRAAINWQSFSIDKGQTTQFVQPNSSSVALNRVVGADPSVIAGTLKANGIIVLVNPSGIAFSQGSQVDVNGLVATVSDIKNQNFMAGDMTFDQASKNPNASVTNKGTITVGQAGLAALVAPSVANSGVIAAKLGKVVLAGAETFTADLYGDGLVSFDVSSKVKEVPVTVDGKPATALVSNTGQITADGGHILLTADAVDGILTDLVDAGGKLKAQTSGKKTGTVEVAPIGDGTTNVTGSIDVSGLKAGQTGGTAVVTGGSVALAATARIDARGAAGGGAVKIGGGLHGKDATVANAKTTTVAAGARIDASATDKGNGGTVAVWSDGTTRFDGGIKAAGGAQGGDGGFVETSGEKTLTIGANASANAAAPNGKAGQWLLDPDSDVDITNATTGGAFNGGTPDIFTPTADSSTADAGVIQTSLNAGTSVTVTTSNPTGTQTGNITVDAAIAKTAGGDATLSLLAGAGGGAGGITISQPISSTTGKLSLVLTTTSGDVSFANTINTNSGTLTVNAGGAISQTAAGVLTVHVGGATSLTGTSVTLTDATNDLVGPITLSTTGNASLTSAGIDLATSSIGGTLTLVAAGGDLTQTGALTVTGTSSFTTSASNAMIVLTTATNALTGAVTLSTTGASGNASLTNNVATSLAASSIGGTLAVIDSTGNLSQTGALTVGGASSFTTSAANATIGLFSSTNRLTGAVTFDTTGVNGNVSLTNNAATSLGASSIGGTLSVFDTAGNLSQTGALTVGGASSFITNTTNATITLTSAANALTGGVTLETTGPNSSASLTNNVATSLAFASVEGTLTVVDSTGSLSQTGGLHVGGASSFTTSATGATITLTNAANALAGAVTLDTTGTGGNASLTNTVATSLATSSIGGALTVVDSTGNLSQTGALTVAGASSFSTSATDATITLTSATNALTGPVTLTTTGTGGNASLTNNISTGTTLATSTVGGYLALTNSQGDVTQTGALTTGTAGLALTGAGTFTLTNSGNSIATVAGNVGTLSLTDSAALTVNSVAGTNNLTATGNVSLTDSAAGGISVTAGQSIASSQGGITGGAGIVLSADSLTLNGAGAIQETGAGGTVAIRPNTASTAINIGGTPNTGLFLTTAELNQITAGKLVVGAIGDTAALTVTGTLDAAANDALEHITSLSLVSGSGGIAINNAVTLAATGILTLDTTGTANATGGALTVSGAGSGLLLLDGGAFTLNTASNSITAVAGTVGTLTLTDSAALSVDTVGGASGIGATGDIALASTVSLALNQAVSDAGHQVTLTGGTISQAAGGTITASTLTGSSVGGTTLDQANDFATLGAFSNTTTGALNIHDSAKFATGGPIGDTVGAMTLVSGSDITIASAVTGTGQTVTLTSGGTLSESTAGTIAAGTLTGSSVTGTSLNNFNQISNLGAFANTTSGGLSVTDNQTLTTTGTVSNTVGALSLTTTTGDLKLNSAITGTGQTVTLTSAGAISQTGVITAGTLTGSSVSGTVLGDANMVGTFGGFSNSTTGALDFTDNQSFSTAGTISNTVGALNLTATTGNITLGTVTGTGQTITISSSGTVTQTALTTISGAGLELVGGGNFTLNNTSVGALAGNVGTLSFGDGTAVTVTTVGGTTGLTATGNIMLSDAAAGGITVSQAVSSNAAASVITLQADSLTLTGAVQETGAGGAVVITPNTASTAINIGGTPNSGLFLTTAELNRITASVLNVGVIGDTGALTVTGTLDAAAGDALEHITNLILASGSGGITVGNAITLASTGTLTLDTSGTADASGAALTVSGAGSGVALLGGGTFTLTDSANSIETIAGNVATLSLTDSAALTVGRAGSATSLSAAGNVTLADSNAGGITVATARHIISTGIGNTIALQTDSLTLNGPVAETGAGGIVAIAPNTASTAINIGGTPTAGLALTTAALNRIEAAKLVVGAIGDTAALTVTGTLDAATGDALEHITSVSLVSGSGGITVSNAITLAATGILTLDTTGTADASAAALTVSGAGSGLALLDGGTFTLTNAGNSIGTVGGSVASLSLADSAALTVNTLGATGAVTLTDSNAGGITVAAGQALSSSATTGTIALQADSLTLNGAVQQTGGGTVLIEPFTASTAVNIGGTPSTGLSLTTAELTQISAQTLAVGAIGDTGALTVTGALNASSGSIVNFTLISGSGGIAINNPVTGPGILTLDTTGTADASGAALTLSGGVGTGLLLLDGGTFTLTNSANSIARVAGSVGILSLTDSAALTIATVGATNSLTATGGVTLTDSAAAGITLAAGQSLSDGATAGEISLQADSVTLTGAVQATGANGRIIIEPYTASTAVNIGGTPSSGLFLTTAELNQITTSTLVVGGIGDTAALTVTGTLDAAAGDALEHVTNLILASGSGRITVSNAITLASTGVLEFDTNGTADASGAALTTSGAGSGLQFQGSGTFTLTDSANSIGTIAGNVGTLSLTDSAALTIGPVGGSSILGATAGNLTLTDSNAGGITVATGRYIKSIAAGKTIALQADSLTLNGIVGETGAGGIVAITPNTPSTAINIGGTPATGLVLTTAELNRIEAAKLVVGAIGDTGALTVTGTLDAAAGDALQHVTSLTLVSGSGGIAINNAITLASTGILTLDTTGTANASAGALTVSGTGSGLALLDGGTFTLNNAGNSVTAVAGTVGRLTLNDNAALAVDTVGAASGITASGDISLQSSVSLTLNQAVSDAGHRVTLTGGTISQAAAGVVTADTLTGSSVGGTTLTFANQVTHLGAFSNSGTGALSFTNAAGFDTTGAIADTVGAIALTTNSGNLMLGGDITGTGQSVVLTAAGTLTQTSGSIAADTLSGGAVGGVTLTDNTNLVNHLGAFANSGSGAFSFTDNQSFDTSGTISSAGALTLTTATGDIALKTAVTAAGQTVTLTSAGAIGESLAGAVTADTLTGSAATGATLTGANMVANLGAFSTGSNGLSFTDSQGFTITGAIGAAGQTVTLNASGALGQTVAGVITAGTLTGGSVGGTTLNAANQIANLGAFTNTASGTVAITDAAALSVTGTVTDNVGDIALTDTNAGGIAVAGNLVTANSGGNIDLKADGLAIAGKVVASGSGATVTLESNSTGLAIDIGTSTAPGDLVIAPTSIANIATPTLLIGGATAGAITVNAPVTEAAFAIGATPVTDSGITNLQLRNGANPIAFDTGGIVTLDTTTGTLAAVTGGGIAEATGAGVVANSAYFQAVTGAALTSATNNVNNLAASVTGGGFSYVDADSFTVGTVTTATRSFTGSFTGVTTSGTAPTDHDIGLVATTGSIGLASNVDALGTGTVKGNVLLSALAGTVSGGIVKSAGLIVRAATIDLEQNNLVDTLSVNGTGTAGVAFNDAQALTIGSVTVAAPGLASDTLASSAAAGDTALKAAGAIAINAGIDAGAANLSLVSTAAITEQSTAKIDGAGLLVQAVGDTVLNSATNDFATLAASITGGGLVYHDANGFSVGTVTVASPSLGGTLSSVTTTGASAADHDIALIGENGGTTAAANTITLTTGNDVNANGADVLLRTVAGASPGGNIVEPEPAGTFTGGRVLANNLIVESAGTIDLEQLNLVTQFGANAVGGMAFRNSGALSLGGIAGTSDVSVSAPSGTTATVTETLNSITAGGDIGIEVVSGGITLLNNITGANIRLAAVDTTGAATGAVTQTAGSVIAGAGAGGLIVIGTGASALNDATNDVGSLAASIANGGFTYRDANGFSVATVTVAPPSLGGTLSGVTTTGTGTHDIALIAENGGTTALANTITLTAGNDVNANGANVLLETVSGANLGGNIVEPDPTGTPLTFTGGRVLANDLIVRSAGTIDLAQLNLVSQIGANAVGGAAFRNNGALTLGGTAGTFNISVSAPAAISDTLDTITAGGDIGIEAVSGGIVLRTSVTAPNIRLAAVDTTGAATGVVNELGGKVTAGAGTGGLIVIGSGAARLTTTTNDVGSLAASSTNGGFSYADANGFSVATVTVAPPSLGGTLSGVTTAGASTHDIALIALNGGATAAANSITIASGNDVNANGANVLLRTLAGAKPGGNIVEPEPAGSFSGGRVLANGLIVQSAGLIDLEQLNLVSQIGASAAGGMAFRNNGALSLGGIAGTSDIIVGAPSEAAGLDTVTAGGDIGIEAVSGGIALLNNLTAPNIRLAAVDTTGAASGAVTQTAGSIVAGSGAGGLIVIGKGDSVLNDTTNDVGTLAASITTGGFVYQDANGFSVGSVTVTPPSLGGTVAGVSTTGASAADHDIALIANNGGTSIAANTLTLLGDVNANGADVLLRTVAGTSPGGNIVEPEPTGTPLTFTGGRVLANDLVVSAAGSIDLAQLNLVSQLGADATLGIAFRNNGALSLGGIAGASDVSVTAPSTAGGLVTITENTVTAGGDIGIEAASGGITLLNNVTATNIRLAAVDTTGVASGAVTQTAGSIVAGGGAGGLIVIGAGASALTSVTNDIGSLASSIANGGFSFIDANGFSVATVTVASPSLGGTLGGVTTTGAATHAIALEAGNGGATATANTITLTAGNDVNANGANVLLETATGANPGGNIVEPEPAGTPLTFTGGRVLANDLIVRSAGMIDLEQLNLVTQIGASAVGGMAFRNNGALSLGGIAGTSDISVSAPAAIADTLNTVTAGGDIGIEAVSGGITLLNTLTAPNIRLAAVDTNGAASGAVTQTAGSIIANNGTGGLIVVGKGDSALNDATNNVGGLAASITDGGFVYHDANGFSVGTVTVTPPSLGGTLGSVTTTGASAADHDIALIAENGIGATFLNNTNSITLTAGNQVNANGADVLLRTVAGSNLGGNILESNPPLVTTGGLVLAHDLIIESAGLVDFDQLNLVSQLGANAVGGIAFRNNGALTLGGVAGTSDITVSAPSTALTTVTETRNTISAGGDIGIEAVSGGITLLNNITAPNIRLAAVDTNGLATGAVNQTAGSIVANAGAGGLMVIAKGDSALNSPTNDVGTLAASITNGGFVYHDANGFTVGTVFVSPPALGGGLVGVTTTGASAADHDIALIGENGGATTGANRITLNSDVNANGADVLLRTVSGSNPGGDIVEPVVLSPTNTTNARVLGRDLIAESASAIDLEELNLVSQFGANAVGGIAFRNNGALSLGGIAGTSDVSVSAPSGTTATITDTLNTVTAGSYITIEAVSGGITLLNNITASTIRLAGVDLSGNLTGAVNQTAGSVLASGLIVTGAGNSALNDATNNVVTLAANVVSGGFTYRDADGFSVGTVALVLPTPIGGTLSGVTTSGVSATDHDVALITNAGAISLLNNVDAQGAGTLKGNLELSAVGGTVSEPEPPAAGGIVKAAGLIVIGNGNSVLDRPTNDVGTLAASITNGGFVYHDANGFAVGTVTVNAPAFTGTLSSVTTTGAGAADHDIALIAENGGTSLAANTITLSAGNDVNANGADVLLRTVAGANPGGNIVEPEPAGSFSGGRVLARDLIVESAGLIDLEQLNLVSQLGANAVGGLAFRNNGALTLGGGLNGVPAISVSAPATAAATITDTLNTVFAGGDMGIEAVSGGITLLNNIMAPNIRLAAVDATGVATGAVTQTAGTLNAGSGAGGLLVIGKGDSFLNSPTNDVGTLAASITGGGFVYHDVNGFSVGTVTVAPPSLGGTLGSVTTTGASAADHDIALIAENGGTTVLANRITLTTGNNVNANGADVLLRTVAGTNPGGDIVEPEPAGTPLTFTGGRVLAHDLIVESAGLIDLEQLNLVSQFGANAVGAIAYRNNGGLSLGGIAGTSDVSLSAPSATVATITDTRNTVTAGGDIGIEAVSGGITLLSNVTAPNIRLAAVDTTGTASGAVTQIAGSIVAAGGTGGLIVIGAGDSMLNDATNDIGTLAASITGGGFVYHDANGFSVGTVTVSPPSLGGTLTGVTTTGASAADHDIALIAENGGTTIAANTITLTTGNDVNANGADVLLRTVTGADPGGNIVESEPAGTPLTFTGGRVLARDLIVESAGTIDLEQLNLVSQLGANAVGGIAYRNNGALSLGGIAGTTDVSVSAPSATVATIADTRDTVTAGGDIGIEAVSGGITLLNNITATNIRLAAVDTTGLATGAVTQTAGGVTATGLIVAATGNSFLAGTTNDVATLSANVTGGGFTYRDTNGFNVGTVTVTPPSLGGTQAGVTTSGAAVADHDIALIATTGPITLLNTVDAQGAGTLKGNVGLSAVAGTVSEPEPPAAGGIVKAAGLIVRAVTVDLEQLNLVDTLAAAAGAGGVAFKDNQALTVNSVTVSAPAIASDTLASTSAAGDIALNMTGELTLNSNIAVGTHSLLLQSGSGISQPSGTITAGGLMVTAAASADLTSATNDITTLAANINGGFSYRDANDFAVGTVAVKPASLGGTLTGVTTKGAATADHDIALVSVAGSISLLANVDARGAGSVLGNVLLSAAVAVSEPEPPAAGGIVKANGLIVEANTVDLEQANLVNIVSLDTTGATGVAFSNGQALTIGSVTVAAPVFGSDTLATSTVAGDAALEAAGVLTLNTNVNAGAGNLLLQSADAIAQTGGTITAGGLMVVAGANATLTDGNDVTTLAANISGSGFSYNDTNGFAVGSVTVASPSLGGTLAGVTTNGAGAADHDIALSTAAGSISLLSAIDAQGAGSVKGNVMLTALAGAVSEPRITASGGTIKASGLILRAATVDLSQANLVDVLTATVTGAAGLTFADSQALSIAAATVAAPGVASTSLTGVTVAGDGVVQTGGTLTVNAGVTVGGHSLLLQTTAGDIVQPEPGSSADLLHGIVTAGGLAVQSAGAIDLEQANKVGTLAATSGTGGIAFNDATNLTIGAVTTAAPSLNVTGLTGVTGAGDTALQATAALTLDANVGTGTHNLLLESTGAGVTQTGGSVTAAGLIVSAAGASFLAGTTNDVTTMAANVTNGGFTYRDANSFAVAPVTVASPSLGMSLSGVTTQGAGSDIALIATTGSITLTNAVNGTGNNILLSAVGGAVTETAGGSVDPTGLIVRAATVDMAQGNLVDTLTIASTGSAGVAFNDNSALSVGTVTVAAPGIAADTLSGVTAAGDTALKSAAALALSGNINVGANNLLLQSGATVTQGASQSVIAGGLSIDAATGATLTSVTNDVATLTANVPGGILAYVDANGFTVGQVTVKPPELGLSSTGIAAQGNVMLLGGGTATAVTIGSSIASSNGNVIVGNMLGQIVTTNGVSISTAPTGYTLLEADSIQQTGSLALNRSAYNIIDTTGIFYTPDFVTAATTPPLLTDPTAFSAYLTAFPLAKPGTSMNFDNLTVQGSLILVESHAKITGLVNVAGELGFVSDGTGSAVLDGSIQNVFGQAAAQFGRISVSGIITPSNDFKFNNCATGSATCVVVPTFVPVEPQTVETLDLAQQQRAFDDIDVERLDTGKEDIYCDGATQSSDCSSATAGRGH